MMGKRAYLFVCLCFLVLGSGCSRTKVISFDIKGDSQMNNGGNFVVLRVYQLANNTNFDGAEYLSFWENDNVLLGDELISGTKQQISFYPPDKNEEFREQTLELEISDGAKFIGFAAKLYDPDGDKWRQTLPVERMGKQKVVLSVKENHIVVDMQ